MTCASGTDLSNPVCSAHSSPMLISVQYFGTILSLDDGRKKAKTCQLESVCCLAMRDMEVHSQALRQLTESDAGGSDKASA